MNAVQISTKVATIITENVIAGGELLDSVDIQNQALATGLTVSEYNFAIECLEAGNELTYLPKSQLIRVRIGGPIHSDACDLLAERQSAEIDANRYDA